MLIEKDTIMNLDPSPAQSLNRSNALRSRAITHPVIARLRDAGYTVTLQDEESGVAVRVSRDDLDLVVRAREAGAALAWIELWMQSKSKEGQ